MRVLFLTNIPSPYRVDFFNELGKMCELDVIFEKAASDERDKSWQKDNFEHFNAIFLGGKSVSTDKALSFKVTKYLKKGRYDHIIVTDIASPTGIIAITHMKLRHISYCIEGDGAFATASNGFKDKLKKFLISPAYLCFSTSKMHDEYYLQYKAKKDRIVRYPFSSVFEKDIIKDTLSPDEKSALREKLDIHEKKVIVTVGQFIKRKGFDILLEACKGIGSDTGVYIIGGQPTQEYLDIIKDSNNKDNIHFVGFKSKSEVFEYFKSADLFVLPTREDIWGLVINEAMACALPVITTNRCIAGLELVKDGENGYIIPVEDADMLLQRMNTILSDNTLCADMGKKSLEIIGGYTIQSMAKTHESILSEMLH